MKVLITGAGGQLGQALHIELEQVTMLFIEERIDTVVNLAAESHVDRSIEHPQLFLRTNVKAGADHLVRAYVQTYGLPSSVSHCSNNYGPYQLPEKLVPLCLLNILEGRTLPIYGDGLQLRNWIHVHDHCRAIDAILNNSPPGEVWNVGSASSEANLTVVRRLCDHVDQEFAANADLAKRFPQSAPARGQKSHQLITHVRDRPGHDRRYAIDCSKLSRQLGFLASTDLTKGLAATVSWYLSNEPWWRSLRNGRSTSPA